MLSEPVIINAIQQGSIQVAPQLEGTCRTCHLKAGCGQALLARYQKRSVALPLQRLQGEVPENLHIGQQAWLELSEASLVALSLLLYLVPLLLLMLALILSTLAGFNEGYTVLLAFSLFGLSFYLLHKYIQERDLARQITLYVSSGMASRHNEEKTGLAS